MTITGPPAVDELPTGLLIGDAWITETAAGTLDHVNPATGKVQQTFAVGGPDDVDAAVRAARAALEVYGRWTPQQRRDCMRRIAALVMDHADDFTRISVLENGMPQRLAQIMAGRLAGWFDYYEGWADKLDGEVAPGIPGLNYTIHEPFGVVGIMQPWNGPTSLIGMKVAAALTAGCTVVLKPPELAPFGSVLFGRICQEAGLPPGVLNVVPGGPDTGQALVEHPGIDKLSFTGGPTTARAIQAACARNLTPLVLELGGKSANIVFADADLDRAATVAANGLTFLSGQVCVAPTRLLVHAPVYDDVVARVQALVADVRIGDPTDPDTVMGPVISEGAADRIMGVIDRACTDGDGSLLVGGERLGDGLADGFFLRPTVFTEVDNRSPLAQNEVFGPVLAISRFDDEADAVEMANDSVYGLAAYLHTNDLSRAHRVAARLDAGNIAVNGGLAVPGPGAPFGGFKDSGYGKEGGRPGVAEYLRVKNVNVNIDPAT